MPELPDVEGFRQVLESCAKGRVIRRVDVRDAGVLHGVSARRLRDALEGRRFGTPERHGKWLLARTRAGPTLVLHFGMTGLLVCGHPDEAVEAHDRVLFTLRGNRQLRFRDQRKLQGIWLAGDDSDIDRLLERQGPDALAVERAEFEAVLSSRRGHLKTALTDQSVLAGLGNLLADEILWRARLRPDRPARDLTQADRRRLYSQMRRTLRSSVTAGCVPPRDSWLTGHRDDPDPSCPRCGTGLRRTRMGGRGTVWCPHCQPGG
ncbi:formamidopyrimidine-DNA glycosylase [Streptomyces violarus]|uniref:Formamidopyrimidine-DNA glycosylase n=1 Tax=Streptomyces violarus TaxID=67380 RepID=A0A7W4ZYV4_9ACTN|nr:MULTISPECIES: DNA-formamidopyrimidine glycosylase family protein [Streptomyces]MBB3081057.1 formamidopyrimidine-DNA glycosylase [Streptomyces violarus]WRU02830.1 DNA-formamidopyrimidine glycosylase family protein [Streptomyces sp. CGMCC 4.1772]GHD28701.1 formamidopyrimidine-DNA glycosylase [Streptomyces violarus]